MNSSTAQMNLIESLFRRFTIAVPVLLLLLSLSAGMGSGVLKAQDVIRASGGTDLSIDDVSSETFTTISGPTIRETESGQLTANGTIRLTLPSGYTWNTSLQSGDISILIEPMGANNTSLAVSFTSISSSEVVFTVTSESETKGNGQGPGRITISGLELRPTSTDVPNAGEISNTGTTGPTSVNYGNLSTVSGSVDAVRVETASDGSGQVVPSQTIVAGQSLQVFSIGRDVGGNFIENVELQLESDWALTGVTGSIQSSALDAANNLRSATFSPTRTGSARIRASYSGANLTESGTITVLPRPASTMEIHTQPSSNATAGSAFSTQPQIRLKDSYGNIVTNDNSTQVTASIASGSGTLLGQTTRTASNGIITFNDLQINQAGTVTLRFQSSGFNSLTSNDITISPAAASKLLWLEQPTNTLPGETISPSMELQLLDAYDNLVSQSGVQVTMDEEPDTETFLTGTTTVSTNSSGVAIFNAVEIVNDNNLSDDESPVQVQAQFSGISSPVVSDNFYILSSGSLIGFEITAAGGGSIGTQEAGVPFDIDIRALDGEGNTYTDFDGIVELTSDSAFLQGGGNTPSFTSGQLTNHTVSLSESGEIRIQAYSDTEDRTGLSNFFTLTPTDVSADESTLNVVQNELTADGESATQVTVELLDTYGNAIDDGGETVELVTTAGTLTAGAQEDQTRVLAVDQGDGTYTATLTSSDTIESATLQAWLGEEANNGELIDERVVEFVAGGLDSFVVQVPMNGETPVTQTAGDSFELTVEAVDANGNRVTSFTGDLDFSSSSVISAGETATIEDGYLENHLITLTKSGTEVTVTATQDHLLQTSGTSVPFSVVASDPSTSASTVVADPSLIQNDGTMQSTVIITVRDEFENRVLTDLSPNVTLQSEQIEQNGTPGSGTPAATIGALSFNSGTSTYQSTVTSSTTIERVEFTGSISGTPIAQTAELDIVQPNTWTPGGGPTSVQIDWNRDENWSLNRVPGEEDFVIIPGGESNYPDLDLNITIGSLLVEQGGELVLFGGNFIDVKGQTEVNGTLDIEDNTQLFVRSNFIGSGTFTGGEDVTVELFGDLSIDNFFVRSDGSVVQFKGDEQQSVNVSSLLAQSLEIKNNVVVNSGNLIDTNVLVIEEGNTLELAEGAGIVLDTFQEITGLGTLNLNDNTLVLGGNTDLENIDTSSATVVFGVRSGEDPTQATHLVQQQIANMDQFHSVTINNHLGVRTFENVDVSGTLTLENGKLIIASGRNLIASDIVYDGGEFTFRRSINNVRGWRMMSTPVNTTFDDLFDGLVTQGILNSTYPDDATYQPSILWYDETHSGTDLQRWRKPADMMDQMVPGRGYYFYVFGDEEGNSDYTDQLPAVLTANGEENQPAESMFDFEVTYTAEADTGWNLVGNPFGATIDWDNESSWVKEHMDNVIYIWEPSSSGYRTWNGITGSLGSGRIAPFHAFWVKANEPPAEESPSLQASPAAKTTGGQFLQQEPNRSDEEWALELKLEVNGRETATHLSFSEEGRLGRDPWDAWYLEPMPFEQNYLLFYSLSREGAPMSIQNLPKRTPEPIRIHLGVGGYEQGEPIQGNYRLSLGDRTTLPENWSVILKDNRTGEEVDLWSVEGWNSVVEGFRQPEGERVPANVRMPERLEPQPMQLSSTSGVQVFGNEEHPFTLTIIPDQVGSGDIPEELYLRQNYPNPFGQSTTIEYGLPEDLDQEKAELVIYNILGQRVETLVSEPKSAGYYEVIWNPARYASGIYLYRLRVGGEVLTRKMTYVK